MTNNRRNSELPNWTPPVWAEPDPTALSERELMLDTVRRGKALARAQASSGDVSAARLTFLLAESLAMQVAS